MGSHGWATVLSTSGAMRLFGWVHVGNLDTKIMEKIARKQEMDDSLFLFLFFSFFSFCCTTCNGSTYFGLVGGLKEPLTELRLALKWPVDLVID